MPVLVAAYLKWRSAPWSAYPVAEDTLPEDVIPLPERPSTPIGGEAEDTEADLPSDISPEEGDFVMQGVDTFGKLVIHLLRYTNSLLYRL